MPVTLRIPVRAYTLVHLAALLSLARPTALLRLSEGMHALAGAVFCKSGRNTSCKYVAATARPVLSFACSRKGKHTKDSAPGAASVDCGRVGTQAPSPWCCLAMPAAQDVPRSATASRLTLSLAC